jgi:hypothetical protein
MIAVRLRLFRSKVAGVANRSFQQHAHSGFNVCVRHVLLIEKFYFRGRGGGWLASALPGLLASWRTQLAFSAGGVDKNQLVADQLELTRRNRAARG